MFFNLPINIIKWLRSGEIMNSIEWGWEWVCDPESIRYSLSLSHLSYYYFNRFSTMMIALKTIATILLQSIYLNDAWTVVGERWTQIHQRKRAWKTSLLFCLVLCCFHCLYLIDVHHNEMVMHLHMNYSIWTWEWVGESKHTIIAILSSLKKIK